MDLFNATPHAITIRLPGGEDVTIPPSGQVARVATNETPADPIGSVPTIRRTLGSVFIPEPPLVEPGDGTEPFPPFIIVSSMVLDAAIAQGHHLLPYLVAPDTGPTAIREGGQVKAVTRLVRA
jgi:hypothetical protein